MKKLLLISSMFIPSILFAQSGDGLNDFVGFIVVLFIAAILFYFLRGVMLWYWKVDTIVKNQEETNNLLRAFIRKLESKNDHLDNQDDHGTK